MTSIPRGLPVNTALVRRHSSQVLSPASLRLLSACRTLVYPQFYPHLIIGFEYNGLDHIRQTEVEFPYERRGKVGG
jgi:hypothetical protein